VFFVEKELPKIPSIIFDYVAAVHSMRTDYLYNKLFKTFKDISLDLQNFTHHGLSTGMVVEKL
jgi:hypothetical protein